MRERGKRAPMFTTDSEQTRNHPAFGLKPSLFLEPQTILGLAQVDRPARLRTECLHKSAASTGFRRRERGHTQHLHTMAGHILKRLRHGTKEAHRFRLRHRLVVQRVERTGEYDESRSFVRNATGDDP